MLKLVHDLGEDVYSEPKQSVTPADACSRLVEGEYRRTGQRNSLLVTPLPTASTSQILGGVRCWTVSGMDSELGVSLDTGIPVHCMYYVWFRVTHFLNFISLSFISLSLLPPLFFSFSLLHSRTYIRYLEYSIRRYTQLEREEGVDFGGCLGSRKKGGVTLSTPASSKDSETMNGFRRVNTAWRWVVFTLSKRDKRKNRRLCSRNFLVESDSPWRPGRSFDPGSVSFKLRMQPACKPYIHTSYKVFVPWT